MDKLTEAITLRANGKLKESQEILLCLVKQYPSDPEVLYQCAWTHDALGLESEAVPYYERALNCGLEKEGRRGALLGLGSTYRTLGEYEQAKVTIEKGMAEFPEAREFKVFYAMVQYNLGKTEHAMELLLNELADTSSDEGIKQYSKAIRFYADKLDQVWK